MSPSSNTVSSQPIQKLKTWADMTKEERAADSAKRKQVAISKVNSGEFPKGMRFTIGNHTLTCLPSGTSEKGAVSYSASPQVIQVMGKDKDGEPKQYNVRINRVSLSILNSDATVSEIDGGADFL